MMPLTVDELRDRLDYIKTNRTERTTEDALLLTLETTISVFGQLQSLTDLLLEATSNAGLVGVAPLDTNRMIGNIITQALDDIERDGLEEP